MADRLANALPSTRGGYKCFQDQAPLAGRCSENGRRVRWLALTDCGNGFFFVRRRSGPARRWRGPAPSSRVPLWARKDACELASRAMPPLLVELDATARVQVDTTCRGARARNGCARLRRRMWADQRLEAGFQGGALLGRGIGLLAHSRGPRARRRAAASWSSTPVMALAPCWRTRSSGSSPRAETRRRRWSRASSSGSASRRRGRPPCGRRCRRRSTGWARGAKRQSSLT